MKVAIELPDDIANELKAKRDDFPRHVLESLALESYRSGVLTEAQVRRLLGFTSRMEVNAFLQRHAAYYDFSEADAEREIQANEEVLNRDTRRR